MQIQPAMAVALVTMATCAATAMQPDAIAPGPPTGPALALTAPIDRWDDALPLGNGLFGVLLWGTDQTLRLSLDRGDLWDNRLPEIFSSPDWTYPTMIRLKNEGNHARHVELFDVPYDTIAYPTKLPTGRLEISLGGNSLDRMALDLRAGTASVKLAADGSAPMDVLVHPLEPTVLITHVPADATMTLIPPAGVAKLGYPAPAIGNHAAEGIKEIWFVQTGVDGFSYAVAAAMRTPTGPNPGIPSIAASVATSDEGTDPLTAARRRAGAAADFNTAAPTFQNYSQTRSTVFDTSSVHLPDTQIQAQYDLCKHLLIAGSRPGAPPIPLQGVWTADAGGLPPWKGDYHNDLNTQMTYISYPAAGLFDQGLSWIQFNEKLLPEYRTFAKEFFGLPSADFPAPVGAAGPAGSTQPAVIPGVMTIRGHAMGGWGQYSLQPSHGAWIAHQFYQHWRFTQNPVFLREQARPFAAAIASGLLHLLKPGPDGTLLLPLSTSPEIHDNSVRAWLTPNSNYDQALLHWLFAACQEMARADGDQSAAAAYAAVLAQIGPLAIDDATGLMIAPGAIFDASHRHFSHAMSIFPLGTLTVEGSDEDRRTIAATLDQLKKLGTAQWTGYSFSWASCMLARAGRGEEALEYLTKYLSFTGRNGFHLNGDQSGTGLSQFTYRPFTLEGNFLAMQAVHEMLLQGWGQVGQPETGLVRIFPAVPRAWADVRFERLWTEGGWRISAERKSGQTVRVEIESTAGGTLKLRDPFMGAGRWEPPLKEADGVLSAEVKKGAVVRGWAKK